jgi:glycosyltransferase involved in cell wall biosynthesis
LNAKSRNIVFFLPDSVGGVSIFVKNFLSYRTSDRHKYYVIQTRSKESNYLPFNEKFDADFQIKFHFSYRENKYYVLNRLKKLLPEGNNLIIANDGLELEMVSLFKIESQVIFILHGNTYYLNLAKTFSACIDSFITVSNYLKKTLVEIIPDRGKDIKHLSFSVAQLNASKTVNTFGQLNLAYAAMLSDEKGINDLPIIDNILHKENVFVNWTIIGSATNSINTITLNWLKTKYVHLLGQISNEAVLEQFSKSDLLIFPSRHEGFGLVLIEAMQMGVVPIAYDLPTGAAEVVENGLTGYKCPIGDYVAFAKSIITLNNDREKLRTLSGFAKKKVDSIFNPVKNSKSYQDFFQFTIQKPSLIKKFPEIQLNTLDKKYIPNLFVKLIRKIR